MSVGPVRDRRDEHGSEERWHEFSISPGDTRTPDICPRCLRPSTARAAVYSHQFQPDAATQLAAGLLGLLIKFLFLGSDSRRVLTVLVCPQCHRRGVVYRVLEWAFRWGGLAASITWGALISSTVKPLWDRDLLTIVLVLLPMVLGAVLGVTARNEADRSRGVAFVRTEPAATGPPRLVLRAQQAQWVAAFAALNAVGPPSSP